MRYLGEIGFTFSALVALAVMVWRGDVFGVITVCLWLLTILMSFTWHREAWRVLGKRKRKS